MTVNLLIERFEMSVYYYYYYYYYCYTLHSTAMVTHLRRRLQDVEKRSTRTMSNTDKPSEPSVSKETRLVLLRCRKYIYNQLPDENGGVGGGGAGSRVTDNSSDIFKINF